LGDGSVALGRWYPAFRPAASQAIINDASKANAQFAMIANVPAVIPLVGGFISAGADMIILTKNQLTMAIKLAAIYGKPLGNRMDILRDLTPVIGGGFLWRTLAREGASFLPLAAGMIPKIAIAYAGTFATGKAVETYYRVGKAPDKEQISHFFQQGMQALKTRFRADPTEQLPEETAAPIG
jgi:uncharacterized protein (DUF697 family)